MLEEEIKKLTEAIKKLSLKINRGITSIKIEEENVSCLTITEFCKKYKISKAFFYKACKDGLMPRVRAVGRRRLITMEEIKLWEKK